MNIADYYHQLQQNHNELDVFTNFLYYCLFAQDSIKLAVW